MEWGRWQGLLHNHTNPPGRAGLSRGSWKWKSESFSTGIGLRPEDSRRSLEQGWEATFVRWGRICLTILYVPLHPLLMQGQVPLLLLLPHLAAEGQEGDDQVEDDETKDREQFWRGSESWLLGENWPGKSRGSQHEEAVEKNLDIWHLTFSVTLDCISTSFWVPKCLLKLTRLSPTMTWRLKAMDPRTAPSPMSE